MSAGTCKHAASGCDYPASECSGKCALDAAPKQSAARHCECHIIGGLCSQCGARVGHNAAPINDGGAAFPMPGMSGLPNDGFIYGEPGMSLRDYFIAHAPHEPQPWFVPTMNEPCPNSPRIEDAPDHLRPEVRAELMEDYSVHVGPEATEWVRQRRAAVHAWTREQEKRRYTQWPAAWADEQLAARGKQS